MRTRTSIPQFLSILLSILSRAIVKVLLGVVGIVLIAIALQVETSGLVEIIQLAALTIGAFCCFMAWKISYLPW